MKLHTYALNPNTVIVREWCDEKLGRTSRLSALALPHYKHPNSGLSKYKCGECEITDDMMVSITKHMQEIEQQEFFNSSKNKPNPLRVRLTTGEVSKRKVLQLNFKTVEQPEPIIAKEASVLIVENAWDNLITWIKSDLNHAKLMNVTYGLNFGGGRVDSRPFDRYMVTKPATQSIVDNIFKCKAHVEKMLATGEWN